MTGLTIALECTTRCNSHCDFCTHDRLIKSGARPLRDLPYQDAVDFIDQLHEKQRDIELFCPTGLGEPLLYPDLLDVIQYAKEKWPAAKIGFSTNGILLNKDLIGAVDYLTVSLCWTTRNQYRRRMGIDKFDQVIENINEFVRLKGNRLPRLRVHVFKTLGNALLFPFQLLKFPIKNGWVYMEPFQELIRDGCPKVAQENVWMVDIDGHIYNSCMGVWYSPDETKHLKIGEMAHA